MITDIGTYVQNGSDSTDCNWETYTVAPSWWYSQIKQTNRAMTHFDNIIWFVVHNKRKIEVYD